MIEVVLVMLSGIFVGYIFRQRGLRLIPKLITCFVYLLLFLLGISVGGNPDVMDNLSTIGVTATMIAVAAVVGSCALSYLVYKFFFSDKEKSGDVII